MTLEGHLMETNTERILNPVSQTISDLLEIKEHLKNYYAWKSLNGNQYWTDTKTCKPSNFSTLEIKGHTKNYDAWRSFNGNLYWTDIKSCLKQSLPFRNKRMS